MVLQYANSGNLRGYLQSHFSKLDWPTKIKMAKEISSGIKCLHNANIVHRDLHDKNILVDNGRMMIADFGLSKSLENPSKSISGGVWTFTDPNYLANQYMFKRGKPSDIYSLGLLFWELSSGFPPFKNVSDVAEIILDLISGKRETPINGTPIEFMNLYCDAWNGDPSSRPNIDEIYHKLNSIQIDSVYHSALEKAILDQGINCYSFNEFSDLKKISIEESDTVYKSIWKTCSKTVALKCLKVNDSDLSGMMIQEFINKLQLLQEASHPNIIRFYGVTKDSEGYYNMILHFTEEGNFREYLEHKFSNLKWTKKLHIAKDIAEGLKFLHSNNLAHCDLEK
ncbi:kinase-like domain-containing protein [Gigaspora rosea]|uniref:Kinase-like domain-containing protein n=1 Tax=Gigaspora rosea TaxID=44941 RepID=A0A397UNK0_9GLOM|nr:kinase-like domain-containing protein [Gigaspora rosea]